MSETSAPVEGFLNDTHAAGETLGVIGVDDRADGARNAGRRPSPANTATLAPLLGLSERVREGSSEEGECGRKLHICQARRVPGIWRRCPAPVVWSGPRRLLQLRLYTPHPHADASGTTFMHTGNRRRNIVEEMVEVVLLETPNPTARRRGHEPREDGTCVVLQAGVLTAKGYPGRRSVEASSKVLPCDPEACGGESSAQRL